MATYETTVHGTIKELKEHINRCKAWLGETLSVEGESNGEVDGIKYCTVGFERYAMIGQGRVSLHVLFLEYSEGVKVVAQSLGGSQAMFFKINHWSEDNFLKAFVEVLDNYKKNKTKEEE